MIKRAYLFWIVLVWIILVSILVVSLNGDSTSAKKRNVLEADKAISGARALFKKNVSEGKDLSNGPCLTNDLMPDWVVDTIHSPRENIDDLPGNQCQAYLEGRAKHFIELDLNGNLVRVR